MELIRQFVTSAFVFSLVLHASVARSFDREELKKAVDPTTWFQEEPDKQYFESHTNNLSTKLFMRASELTLDVAHKNSKGDKEKGTYNPATEPDVGVELSVKGFTLSGSVRMPQSSEDRVKYGRSTYDDLNFSYFWRYVGFDVGYQRYRGFYLDKWTLPDDKDTDKDDDLARPQRPDMKMTNLYGNVFLIPWGHRVSMRAAFDQTEQQLIPAWSPVLVFGAERFVVDARDSLVPQDRRTYFGDGQDFRRGEFTTLSGSVGALGIYPFKKNWFMLGMLAIGTGYQWQKSNIQDQEQHGQGDSASVMMSFGRNLEDKYYGMNIMVHENEHPLQGAEISNQTMQAVFFVGMRLESFYEHNKGFFAFM